MVASLAQVTCSACRAHRIRLLHLSDVSRRLIELFLLLHRQRVIEQLRTQVHSLVRDASEPVQEARDLGFDSVEWLQRAATSQMPTALLFLLAMGNHWIANAILVDALQRQ